MRFISFNENLFYTFHKSLKVKMYNYINNFNSNNIKNDNFNPKHKRANAKFFSNVNTVHLHNFTDVY